MGNCPERRALFERIFSWEMCAAEEWPAVTPGGGSREKCAKGYPGQMSVGNVQIPMHDYKSLRKAVMICATLVNTQTHRGVTTTVRKRGKTRSVGEVQLLFLPPANEAW